MKRIKKTTAGGEALHPLSCQFSPALMTHYESSAAEIFCFTNAIFLFIPCGTYWHSAHCEKTGSRMESLSHNENLGCTEHVYKKWFKIACLQQKQWYHQDMQTDITYLFTPSTCSVTKMIWDPWWWMVEIVSPPSKKKVDVSLKEATLAMSEQRLCRMRSSLEEVSSCLNCQP